jgi:MinD-like ATPase involved in chromosome partitioning or flagellar assembly
VVLVVTSTDRSDVEGTQRMIHDLYELFAKKTGIIMNKVLLDPRENDAITLETCGLPVVGVVPCSCDILDAEGKCLFASEKPNHPFTRKLQEIAANLMVIRGYSALRAPKALKIGRCASDNAASFPKVR